MTSQNYPRILIAGLGGDSGKTIVSCGLLACFREMGMSLAPYKKGPDYIDASWLAFASGVGVRNLDTFMVKPDIVSRSFLGNSFSKDLSLIEGNRGLFDGLDSSGTHSSASLARLLKCPVIIVLTATKVTRTAAAIILGCKMLEPDIEIKGVILNRVAGTRHEKIIRDSIESETDIPVVGALPKIKESALLPSRHLGLITPSEYESAAVAINEAKRLAGENIDIAKILEIARSAVPLEFEAETEFNAKEKLVRIGVFRDKAFSFYYAENIDALERSGAEIIYLSSIEDSRLLDIDGLYIGGGFPETNSGALAANREMMKRVKSAAEEGMPVYAECGGLIYVCGSLEADGRRYEMCGIFPEKLKLELSPQGHGYVEAIVDAANPFFDIGTEIKGHEFHYTRIIEPEGSDTCIETVRGSGAVGNRDGLIYKNTFASFVHIHSDGCQAWARKFVDAALKYKKIKD